jgi:small subunit ribosomal protein S20
VANIKSAKKRIEIIRARTARNVRIKSALRTTIRKFETAISTSSEEVVAKMRQAVQAIDKAVTKGILHKKTAARKKSRLMKAYNKKQEVSS